MEKATSSNQTAVMNDALGVIDPFVDALRAALVHMTEKAISSNQTAVLNDAIGVIDADVDGSITAERPLKRLRHWRKKLRCHGSQYDVGSDVYKLVTNFQTLDFEAIDYLSIWEFPADCVYINSKILARITGNKIDVFTKEAGYCTFIDMPANKANELTGVLQRFAVALQVATGATSVAIICKGTGEIPVFTLEPTGGCTVDKENFVTALNSKPLDRLGPYNLLV